MSVTRAVHEGATTGPPTPEIGEQLSLLPQPTAPLRFRLDEATRRRGLRHIAEIRAQLEQHAA
jgi:hypothetical protein